MAPSDVNNAAREDHAALKRWFNRTSVTLTAGGGTTAYTLTPSVALSAYADEIWTWIMPSTNAATATLNVSGLGARNIQKLVGGTWTDVSAGDLPSGGYVGAKYDTGTSKFRIIWNAVVPVQTAGDNTITSLDASAAVGPSLTLDRNSASPAASDVLGAIPFNGRDSGAGTNTYARVYAVITDPTAASEDGELRLDTVVAGTEANRLRLGAGLYTAAATGGDKGVDTVNAATLYENGNRAGWPLLGTLTGGGTAYNFTATSSTLYAGYFCLFEKVFPATDGANLQSEVSIDAGSSYITTGTYHNSRVAGGGTTAVSSVGSLTNTTIPITGTQSNANAQYGFSGDATVSVGGASANATEIVAKGRHGLQTTGESISVANASGSNTTTSQVNAFRFRFSSGNITSGTIRIYGIPK